MKTGEMNTDSENLQRIADSLEAIESHTEIMTVMMANKAGVPVEWFDPGPDGPNKRHPKSLEDRVAGKKSVIHKVFRFLPKALRSKE